MPLVVTNALLIRLVWNRGGVGSMVNVLGATGVGPSSVNQALANTIGANVKSLFTSSTLSAAVHTSVTLEKVGVRSIGAVSQPEYLDAGAGVAGLATGDYLPPQICTVVTMRTALAGQEYRGRVYLGGFSESSNDATGQANPGLATATVAFIDGLRTGQFGAALTLCIISRKLNIATPVTLVLSRSNVWETQRRRAIPGI